MNEQELQLLRRLEYIKYITLTQGRVKHSSNAERTHYSNGNNGLTLNTPEGLTLNIINFRINYKRPDGEGKCFITIDWARDDNGNYGANYAMTPSLPIKNMANGNKLFIFHSDQFRALPEENRNYFNSEIDNFLNIGGFWLHQYSILIEIEQENGHFQAFMNMEYGSESSVGTWKYFFTQALNQALDTVNPNINDLLKYDFRIFQNEISNLNRNYLLENFDILELPSYLILNLLDTRLDKENVKNKSIDLILYLKNNSTGLLRRLNYYFLEESDDYFFKFHNILNSVFQETLDYFDFLSIESNAINTFENFDNNHQLFIKLAEQSNIYFYNIELGILNQDANFVTKFDYNDGLSTPNQTINDHGQITLDYKCYKDFQIGNNPFLDIDNLDPFIPIKLFFIEGFEQLKEIDTKEKYLKHTIFSENKERVKFTFGCSFFLLSLIKAQNDSIYKHASDIAILQGALATSYQFPLLSVSGGLSIATVMSFSGSVLFNDPEISSYLNQNYPNFISDWNYIQQGILIMDVGHAGLQGVKNIKEVYLNYSEYKIKVDNLKATYNIMPAKFRERFKILRNGGIEYMELILKEWKVYKDFVIQNNAFLPGWSPEAVWEYYLTNGYYPPNEMFLTQTYIQNYRSLFESEGGAFIFTKADIRYKSPPEINHTNFNPTKYFALKNELRTIINKYKVNGNLGELEYAVGFEPGDLSLKLREYGGEIYIYEINNLGVSGIPFKLPEGGIGANGKYLPGARTSGGYWEAQLDNHSLIHNNDIDYLLSLPNVKPLKDW